MAKSEAEAEVTCVDLMFRQWKEPATIDKCICQICHTDEPNLLDLQEFWGVGGISLDLPFSWILTYFLIQTVSKALDRDSDFV